MADLASFRAQHPEYGNVSDAKLAVALHQKYYSSIPMVDYLGQVGVDRRTALDELYVKGDDPLGKYLIQSLEKPGSTETPDQAATRYGGKIETRSPGALEGAGRSFVQGGMFGWGDEIVGTGAAALDKLTGRTPGNPSFGDLQGAYTSRERGNLDQFRKTDPWIAYPTEIAGAVTTAIPTTFGSATTLVPRIAEGVANGIVQGGIYGAGAGDEDRLGGAVSGGALGGVFGAAAPVAGQMLRRVVTPAPASVQQQLAADTLRREGIGLTAGQATGSTKLKYLESELGGGAADRFMERQAEEYTAAVLRRAGIQGNRATPQVIDDGLTRIGNEFDRLAANNQLTPDSRFWQDVNGIWQDYSNAVGQSARSPIIENTIRDIAAQAQSGGVISGETYKTLTSRLARIARGATDPELRMTLGDLRSALDDAMERGIAATNPNDLGAWRAARSQYRNMLVIEKAATGAGADTAAGLISPAQLRNAAIQQGRRAFARGFNDFAELANAGRQALSKLPQSGTAPRLAARAVASIPAALGALAGSPGGFMGAGIGAAAGASLPFLLGRMILSGPGRAMLGNQLATGTGKMLPELAGLPGVGGGLIAGARQ